MKYRIFILINTLFLCSTTAFSRPMPFAETTRMQSSAGAGVGSLLITEVSLLNPASIVFFNDSTLYYHKGSDQIENEHTDRTTDPNAGKTEIVSITDTSSPLKGGLSYQYQNNLFGKRKRFSTSLASTVSPSMAMGFIYNHTEENSELYNETYGMFTVGMTKVYSESLTVGATIVDPAQSKPEYFKYTIGFQYTVNPFIDVIADMGSGDVANRTKESFHMWAVQLKSFDSIYLRYGQFHDQHSNFKGTSLGVSWVGPKLTFGFSTKSSENIANPATKLFRKEKLTDTSFSMTYLF